MSNSDSEYISVEAAAETLRMTARQVNRYGNEGRIQTRRAGRRVLYLRTDVEALAVELGVAHRPAPRPRAELVPVGHMLDYIRERDTRLDDLQKQLLAAAAEIGRLQQALDQTRLLADQAELLRQRVADLEEERNQLRAELDQIRSGTG